MRRNLMTNLVKRPKCQLCARPLSECQDCMKDSFCSKHGCPSCEGVCYICGAPLSICHCEDRQNPTGITLDQLQNEILLIAHHVEDAEEALKEGDLDYIQRSLTDIKEVAKRLGEFLPPSLRGEIKRIVKGR